VNAAEEGLERLETELRLARQWGARATHEMHATLVRDLAAAEKRAGRAQRRAAEARKRAADAERRARHAERELAQLHESTTWKAGRAVVAVPARLRRLVRR